MLAISQVDHVLDVLRQTFNSNIVQYRSSFSSVATRLKQQCYGVVIVFFVSLKAVQESEVHKLAVQPEDMVLFDFCLQIGNALVNDRSYLLLLVLSITQYVGIRSGCDLSRFRDGLVL